MYSPQFAGWVRASEAGDSPSVSATCVTTHSAMRAMHSSADTGVPPSSSGVGSPTRRLNSRATRWGSVIARRAAGSPTRKRSVVRHTTDGTAWRRVPSVAVSTRPSRPMAAAVQVVPTSTPRW